MINGLGVIECVCGLSRPFSFESGRLVVRPRPQCNIQVFHLGRSYSAVSGTILHDPFGFGASLHVHLVDEAGTVLVLDRNVDVLACSNVGPAVTA